MPEEWSTGSFDGLIARGGFKVSARWENGKVISCKACGKDDAEIKVKINGEIVTAKGCLCWGDKL